MLVKEYREEMETLSWILKKIKECRDRDGNMVKRVLFIITPVKSKTHGHGERVKEREREARIVARGPIKECGSNVESHLNS